MKTFILFLTWNKLLDSQTEVNGREPQKQRSWIILSSFIHFRFNNSMETTHQNPRWAVPQHIPGITPKTPLFCFTVLVHVNLFKNQGLRLWKYMRFHINYELSFCCGDRLLWFLISEHLHFGACLCSSIHSNKEWFFWAKT